jgi:hypothetical protein
VKIPSASREVPVNTIRDFGLALIAVFVCAVTSIVSAVTPAHAQWLDGGAPVCTSAGDEKEPTAVPDGAGGAIIAWTHLGTGWSVYAQRISGDGEVLWPAGGVPLCEASWTCSNIAMVSDGAGGAIVAWEDQRAVYADIYAQRVDGDGNVLWITNGIEICTADDRQVNPSIASDGSGGSVIVWSDYRNGDDADLYAQRINADGDTLWMRDGEAITTRRYYEDAEPLTVSDGAHGAIVAWYTYPDFGPFHIYCARIDAYGILRWTTDLSGYDSQFEPSIAPYPGGAIIAWNEARDVLFDIFAQKVDTSGVEQWDSADVPVCTAPGSQVSSRMIPDGSGGAIVAWRDLRSGENDIYARRVDTDGDTLWAPLGTPVCTAAGDQERPQLAADGSGGAYIVWQDARGLDNDIYVQGIDVNGNVRWALDGIPICTETKDQRFPCITEKDPYGAIMAWVDERDDSDLYAQRVEQDGTTETELLCWTSSLEGSVVRISWTLSEREEDAAFSVCRATLPDGDFEELAGAPVTGEGLELRAEDMSCDPGKTYIYRVIVNDSSGSRVLFESGPVTVPAMPVTLLQNTPNPFNPLTTIRYYLPERMDVSLAIFDAAGREVEVLERGERSGGCHDAVWNAAGYQSGLYFCRLKAGKVSISRKLVLLR